MYEGFAILIAPKISRGKKGRLIIVNREAPTGGRQARCNGVNL